MPNRNLSRTVNTSQPDLDSFANQWLDNVRAKIINPQLNDMWREKHNEPEYMTLEVESSGTTYLRIWSGGHRQQLSCWAFIALKDGETKGMGKFKRGDIFKPATWKAPAKTARGNIFEPGEDGCANVTQWTGPSYIGNWRNPKNIGE